MENLSFELSAGIYSEIGPVLKPGAITLAATPIGNTLDASLRLIIALQEADLIAAEDTRKLKNLATRLGIRISAQSIAFHEHNENEKSALLVKAAQAGQKVLVVSDAGMPVISDPGFKAVLAAKEDGTQIEVIPGPSAPITALVHSGLAPDRFSFEGFLPKTSGKLETELQHYKNSKKTAIFFESPRRLAETLKLMKQVLGAERKAAVGRELTKIHEEIITGSLTELCEWAESNEILGEIVVVLSPSDETPGVEDLLETIQAKVATGMRLKDAAKAIAAENPGISARELYQYSLAAN